MADSQPGRLAGEPVRQPVDINDASLHVPATVGIQRDLSDLVQRLARHRTLGSAPLAELEWLAAHGRLERREAGELVNDPSVPITAMFILLDGRISIHMVRGNARHKVAEWHGGDVTGLLPYSRLVHAPGDTVVEETVEMLVIPREHLAEMTRECQEVTSLLVHVMLDRARFFTSTLLHDEKLKSLGRLAAGLAHELNNPAAAITRFAKILPPALDALEAASQALALAGLDPDELAAARRLSETCQVAVLRKVRSPIEEAEREDEIAAWLGARGIDAAAAEAVAQSRVTIDALESLERSVRPAHLAPALHWVAADSAIRDLASEIDHAGTRISDLVAAVRGFTRVDSAGVPQPVDIGQGLDQTLAVLRGKARDKAVGLTVSVEDGLPPARGLPAELNQVWSNLIDNALDAAPRGGHVTVSASRRDRFVVVRVVDDGDGIPAEIRDRIFDPFFTTKDVGRGSGLGLDIVRRLVERHDGDIEVSSEPGRTEFAVSLPIVATTLTEHPA